MSDFPSLEKHNPSKSFWKRPEGIAGAVLLVALLGGGGYLLYVALPYLITLTSNLIYLTLMILVLAAIVYMVFDPKMRTLISYMYQSIMRSITGWFITIDPIGILKNYVDDLRNNLTKMSKQIGNLRGQMRKLKTIMEDNDKEIENSLMLAKKAKEKEKKKQILLNTRKASRLKESNAKYETLHNKMEILYRVLTKMYQNSEILLEDTKDQVRLKEEERKAIRASHSSMKSAMNVISGNSDKKIMFDRAVEAIADDVAQKMGEMERFMELSSNFMDSVDLQNGVFEDKGLKMLQEWEEESSLMLLSEEEKEKSLDFDDAPERKKEGAENSDEDDSDYEKLFE